MMRPVVSALLVLVAVISTLGAQKHRNPPHAYAPRYRIVVVGQHFSCGLGNDGQVSCWGANYYGQLGSRSRPGIAKCERVGDLVSTCAMLPVPLTTTEQFTDLAAGLKHACAVANNGAVWCWGRNEAGQLGAEATDVCTPAAKARAGEEFARSDCSFTPLKVEGLPHARLVAAGDDFSCALTDADDDVWCWGGSAGARPRRVSPPEAPRFMTIDAGYTDVCADADDPRVACWSLYDEVSETRWYTVTEGLWRVTTGSHTCAIGEETNRAYCWGFNASGSLGIGTHRPRERVDTPTAVAGNRRFVRLDVSFLGTCGLEASGGELYCWGSVTAAPQPDKCSSGSEFGGSHGCALTPQAVFPRMNLHGLALTNAHGCALAADRAFCWGPNSFGEVGNGTTRAVLDRPVVVGVLPAERDFPMGRRAIAAIGFGAFLALAFYAIRFAGRPAPR